MVAVPGQRFIYPDCEGFTYFGISPNGSVTLATLSTLLVLLDYHQTEEEPGWPGTPQTDYVGFDDNGNLKVNKQGIPTDGVSKI